MNVLLICLTVVLHSKAVLAKFHSLSDDVVAEQEQQQQQTDDGCVYKPNMGSILKTNESIADKAVFLQFHEGQTKEACLEKCCSLSDCNLAVYERKDRYSCYLFNCGSEEKSRCHFSHHEDYMTMEFSPRPLSHKSKATKATQDKHEDDLEGLMDNNINPTEAKTTTTSKSTTRLNLPTTQSSLTQKTGEVFGDCTEEGKCKDDNALCHKGVCICPHGGYDFINNRCKNLTPKGKSKGSGHGEEPYHPNSVNENEDGPPVEPPHVDVKPETTRPTTTTLSTTTTTKPTVTPATTVNVTTSTTLSPVTTTKQPSTTTSKTNSTDTHTKKVVYGGLRGVEVEQILIASPTDSAQGPIVALALGLAFTIMLLAFVGCRLRNVKRRIRKGRPLHSNEADYLINGMYL